MEKLTLQFNSIIDLAKFIKAIDTGYLMNTIKLTVTGRFTESDIELASGAYKATVIETTENVYSYE
jgi:hypothetical protein